MRSDPDPSDDMGPPEPKRGKYPMGRCVVCEERMYEDVDIDTESCWGCDECAHEGCLVDNLCPTCTDNIDDPKVAKRIKEQEEWYAKELTRRSGGLL